MNHVEAPHLAEQAARFRDLALQAFQQAQLAPDKYQRHTYFNLARRWHGLAQQVELAIGKR